MKDMNAREYLLEKRASKFKFYRAMKKRPPGLSGEKLSRRPKKPALGTMSGATTPQQLDRVASFKPSFLGQDKLLLLRRQMRNPKKGPGIGAGIKKNK